MAFRQIRQNLRRDGDSGLLRGILEHDRNADARTECVDMREQRRAAGLQEKRGKHHHAVRPGRLDMLCPLDSALR